jgi:hypothetical protein
MPRAFFFALSGLAGCLMLAIAVPAGGRTAADYPLRIQVLDVNWHSHYNQNRVLDFVDGEGRANLFENKEPRGFDFGYTCNERFRGSMGYETYMARWKKPGRELEILVPVMGKPGVGDACVLKVDMKDTVYFKHNGMTGEEPAAVLKDWMEKHQYDPEHGKNDPVMPPQAPSGPNPQQ